MTCPVCFFREDFQKRLKRKAFGINRYEDKLRKYKEVFIEEMQQMGSLSTCSCRTKYSNDGLIHWTDAFLDSWMNAESEVISAFDEIISVYEDYISRNQRISTERLWSYLKSRNLLTQAESPLNYGRLLFRARLRGRFDECDIKQYFHIPFSHRHLVGNQRFSVSGQPMVYFGNSVLVLTKELDHQVSDLAIAAFLPNFSHFYESRIYSLTNYIEYCIEKTLPGIFASGSVSYTDTDIKPNYGTINEDINSTILMHICTYPTEYRGTFVAEYVIPQLLTTALLEHEYHGVLFPSTKNYSDLYGQHRFSSHNLNLGLFVPYDRNSNLSEELLGKFTAFMLNRNNNQDSSVQNS